MHETEMSTPGIPAQLAATPNQEQTSLTWTEKQPLSLARYNEGSAVPEFSRLIVLVPDKDVDETAFARKIWALLGHRRVSILLITLVTNSSYGPGAQRRLVTLAAITRDIFYKIETRVVYDQTWTKALAEIVQPGDLVACHASQRSRSLLRKDTALADVILSQVKAPVIVLSGLYQQPVSPRPSRFLRQLAIWGILVGILTIFFVFEADIDHITTGWMSSLLLILVFTIEIAFIWLWNFLRI